MQAGRQGSQYNGLSPLADGMKQRLLLEQGIPEKRSRLVRFPNPLAFQVRRGPCLVSRRVGFLAWHRSASCDTWKKQHKTSNCIYWQRIVNWQTTNRAKQCGVKDFLLLAHICFAANPFTCSRLKMANKESSEQKVSRFAVARKWNRGEGV